MKRITKIMILAGLMALCLILAGCQQQPQDTTNTQAGNAVTAALFATLPPSEAPQVTPDVKIWGNEEDMQDDLPDVPGEQPTSAGIIGWDNAQSTDQAGVAPVVTPGYSPVPGQSGEDSGYVFDPSAPTPTPGPSPTPKSLQRGFTDSEEVRAMQKRLKELGYYKGSADGDFGPATEKAVMAFQKDHGLTADGKAGAKTLAKMNESGTSSSSKASSSSDTSTSLKISKDIYLEPGKKGKNVKTLQKRLIELGYLSGSASGTYDDATEAAVIAFQKKSKLWADGKAGPKTLEKMFSSKAPKGSKAVSSDGETLALGSKGSEVKKLQKRLIDLGYLTGSADGSFGEATEAALIEFQKTNGLTADGKAGTATQNKLYGDEAKKAGSTASGQ